AEDGIRDWSVTGVQTCALPISPSHEALSPCYRVSEERPARGLKQLIAGLAQELACGFGLGHSLWASPFCAGAGALIGCCVMRDQRGALPSAKRDAQTRRGAGPHRRERSPPRPSPLPSRLR